MASSMSIGYAIVFSLHSFPQFINFQLFMILFILAMSINLLSQVAFINWIFQLIFNTILLFCELSRLGLSYFFFSNFINLSFSFVIGIKLPSMASANLPSGLYIISFSSCKQRDLQWDMIYFYHSTRLDSFGKKTFQLDLIHFFLVDCECI